LERPGEVDVSLGLYKYEVLAGLVLNPHWKRRRQTLGLGMEGWESGKDSH
jgi:hypothetical protein